jgi:hypothetical protein
MQVYELPNETKAATGFTHKAIVTHVDLTEPPLTPTRPSRS